MPNSTTDNEREARNRATLALHLEAEARHDATAAASYYAEDGGYDYQTLGLKFAGRDAVEYQYAASYASMPDLEFRVEQEIVEGDAIVQFGVFEGTLDGPFLGLPATGRTIEVPLISQYEFRDGQILSERITFDRAEFAKQAGFALADLEAAAGLTSDA